MNSETARCPDCGEKMKTNGYIQECDYCLSKKED
ncbi:YhfH family protein [Virgibacillus sp. AGTR]|uniref:YhfH family protein n=1 Tax=Virgibacillus salarius TaxID=447199 RepID=A0A941DPY5_9BACI|nr:MULTISPECIES: YhfH family protein [Bacillaceae]MBR7794450.1 YhfH family protein [Virgibacillus salarius]MCC2248785.1 YhfH family protein [Virgibacillus sp. AGTR]MDY7045741.1 YhfH family protein [Virgibacillus sp. M23]QRZ20270.1 YhfH family protein [Virgibacillus sp. AGTR]WBX82262.1 YhfH family protein [Virgibacillus salarius]